MLSDELKNMQNKEFDKFLNEIFDEIAEELLLEKREEYENGIPGKEINCKKIN